MIDSPLFQVKTTSLPVLLSRLSLRQGLLDGKVALVTGAARGIGEQTARGLAYLGASVVLVDKRDAGARVAASIEAAGGTALFIPTDLSIEDHVKEAYAQACDTFGKVDILVNDAVHFKVYSVLEMSLEDWGLTQATNIYAPLVAIKLALPDMMARGEGVIVNMVAPTGLAFAADMSCSKAALRSLTVSLAAEVSKTTGVSIFGFAPGLVATPLVADVFPRYTARIGIDFEEYVQKLKHNPGYAGLMPAEDCAAGLVYALVHAEEHHGRIAEAYHPLRKAGVITFSDTSEGTNLPGKDELNYIENLTRLREYVTEIVLLNQHIEAEAQDHELGALTKTLLQRVEAHARELTRTNQALEREITERKQAEERLAKTLSLLQATLESTADGLLVVDADGKMVGLNEKFVTMWCIPEEIVASRDDDWALAFALDQLVDPETFIAGVWALYAEPAAESFDVLHLKDGRVFERFSQPQRLGGQVVGRVWSFRDVTERKRAEEAQQHYARRLEVLREIDRAILAARSPEEIATNVLHRLQTLIPCIRASVLTFDLEKEEVTVVAAQTRGKTTLGKGKRFPLAAVLPDEEQWRGEVCIVEDMQTFDDPRPVFDVLKREGVRSFISAPLMAQGELVGIFNVGADRPAAFTAEHIDIARELADLLALSIHQARLHEEIQGYAHELEDRVEERTEELAQVNKTLAAKNKELRRENRERKQAEAEINRLNNFYEQVLTSMPSQLAVFDLDGRYRYVNPSAISDPQVREWIIGKTNEEFCLERGYDLALAHQRDGMLKQVVHEGKTLQFEEALHTRSGEIRHFIRFINPVLDAEGTIIQVLGYGIDITERKQAEAEINRLNNFYEQVLTSMPTQLAVYDLDGRYRYVNPSAVSDPQVREWIIGKTNEEFCLERGYDLEIAYRRNRAFKQLLRDRQIVQREETMRTRSGGIRHFLRFYSPALDAEGNLVQVLAYGLDITDRKRMEEALQERDERMRLLYEVTSQTGHSIDEQLQEALKLTTNLLGLEIGILSRIEDQTYTVETCYAPETELGPGQVFDLGQTYCVLTFEANDVVGIDHMKRSKHQRHPCYKAFQLESYLGIPLQVNGERYGTLNFSGVRPKDPPFSGTDQELIRLLGQWVSSVLERKQAEEDLHWQTGLLKRAEELAHVGHWHVSLPSGTLEWSDEIYRIHGVEPEDIELTLEYGINAYHPEDRNRVSTVVQEAIDLGKEFEFELRIVRPDASIRHVVARGECVLDEGGETEAIFGVFQDITERKRTEVQIQQLNENLTQRALALETANQELESFSYSVSHDLRAPLRAIDGFAVMLAEDYAEALPQQAHAYLQTIQQNAQGMDRLIEGLLAFSRLGRQALHPQRIDVAELTREVFEDLLHHEDEERRVELTVGAMPACQADPVLLRQVWVNLLSNALKFTQAREAARIEVGSVQQESEMVYFVKDNGVGFDMAYADKLFQVFQRLHLVEEYEGTGVGLALVQRIVRRHGGRVWAEARVDEGATFYFTLG